MVYPWQTSQWRQLLQAYQQQRLSHAYLLSGSAGLGKQDFAKALGKFLLCESTHKTTESCGHCRGCQWVSAETHPDLFLLSPDEKGHSIKIDAVRDLSQKLAQTAQCGGYQVVVISPAEMMPVGAANALLKTLEEPAGKVVLLLVSDHPDRLLPTIISRTQHIQFQAIHDQDTVSWLATQMAGDHDFSVLLKVASNAPLKVHALIGGDFFALRDLLLEQLLACVSQNAQVIAVNSKLAKLDKTLVLQTLLLLCIDLSRVQQGVSTKFLVNHDCENKLRQLALKISSVLLSQYISTICQKKKLLEQGANLNFELLLDFLMIEWWERLHVY